MPNRMRVLPNGYVNYSDAYAITNLTVSHRFLASVDGVAQIQNLTDFYLNDYHAEFASLGRQTKVGLRVHL